MSRKETKLTEFGVISRYFGGFPKAPDVVLGVGDDCAVVRPLLGYDLVLSIDTQQEGSHFLPDSPAEYVAVRALCAAASDLAAMGAYPRWFTLALSLPETDESWLEGFSRGLRRAADRIGIRLVGGDTTRGPLAITIQVHGEVPSGQSLMRKGAQPGDYVAVTGPLGDSRGGLARVLDNPQVLPEDSELVDRFYQPWPRIPEGIALRGLASACIDISDGLLADLGHLLGDELGAELESARLPISEPLLAAVGRDQAIEWACSGGEDFELCFTLPPHRVSELRARKVPFILVGRISDQPGIRLDGSSLAPAGYDHFRS